MIAVIEFPRIWVFHLSFFVLINKYIHLNCLLVLRKAIDTTTQLKCTFVSILNISILIKSKRHL